MVDPIISTGLAKDWLERILKSWATLRKTREDELQEIRNVFGDPKLLADYYIEPDCQPVNPADHDEDESIRAFRQPVRVWLNRFLEGEFFERDGRNTVFVLSDAGMGKTSLLMMLKLTHLLKLWPSGLDFRLMKLGPDTLEKLTKIQNQTKTVLLLDSLDEDSSAWGRIEERLMELLDATKSFRQVILTCRTQFFPEGSAAPIEGLYKVVVRGYICNLLYLSPFDNAQVEAYLRNVYPNRWRDLLRKWWKKEDNPNLVRARKVVEPMKSLRLRPMLLAHIDELMQSEVQEWREFPVYDALVRHWLLRELRKKHWNYTEAQLWELCEEVAIFLQRSGKRVLSLEDLEAIRHALPAAETLEAFDIGGRSLLNRTSDRGFRFSHYSIQEFLVARRLVLGKRNDDVTLIRSSDQLVSFLLSWIYEWPHARYDQVTWRLLDLRGVNLSGRNLSNANLKGALLDGAALIETNLAGADLRGASLKNCVMHRAKLRGVDARGADFSGCVLIDADLFLGKFAGADFQGANLDGIISRGAGFLRAKGISVYLSLSGTLDPTAGLPIPRSLAPIFHVENGDKMGLAIGPDSSPDYGATGRRSRGAVTWNYKGLCWMERDRSVVWSPIANVRREPPVWKIGEIGIFVFRENNFSLWNGVAGAISTDSVVSCESPGGDRIAAISDSGEEVVLHSRLTGQPVSSLKIRALAIAWHPGGNFLAIAVPQGAIEIWYVRKTPSLLLTLFDVPPSEGLVITGDGYVDGPPEALQYVRFADGEALYDLEDLPERHDPERVRQAMAILSS